MTSVIDPMTVFLYRDGLVRLASEKYTTGRNKDGAEGDRYVHLTNYSLNKLERKSITNIHSIYNFTNEF